MLTRREFMKKTAQAGAVLALPAARTACADESAEVNDVQSQLNATRVSRIARPATVEHIEKILRVAAREDRAVSVAGGRHAMGGQQFGRDMILIDTTSFSRVLNFDRQRGLIDVESGIQWPELIAYLNREQEGAARQWAIREKQTGVDKVSIGGSLASNVHGRGLKYPPIIGDVEAFEIMDGAGKVRTCSRRENAELFSLAIGGYGLFGIITRVTLRLVPRAKVERVVDIIPVKDLLPAVEKRIQQGFTQGDCQYSTDVESDPDAHRGVFSCYRPVAIETPIPQNQKELAETDWADLYRLARTDRKKAFQKYFDYYTSTSGQVYWSDTHQLAGSFGGYSQAVEAGKGTEMITEVYVGKENFLPLMAACRRDAVEHKMDLTYGTIRFIEKDAESFLAWAKEPSVCIVCNLHVMHTSEGRQKASADFRRIIDRAIEFGGRYYLTYHRWAARKQIETCYPQFVEFLRLKKKFDPHERIQSDWYRHYKEMFADRLG